MKKIKIQQLLTYIERVFAPPDPDGLDLKKDGILTG